MRMESFYVGIEIGDEKRDLGDWLLVEQYVAVLPDGVGREAIESGTILPEAVRGQFKRKAAGGSCKSTISVPFF